ncbi:MAG TPA: PAS domain S-box protein [Nitrospira sp.]|nr:PAS domain S-box protein [Nitrospira sp.]
MHHLRSFQLRDMTACGAALRQLGAGARTFEDVADRLVRHLYTSLTMPQTGQPACVLIRLFKTTRYELLAPDLKALADQRLGDTSGAPSMACLTLVASAGMVPGWNDPTLSSRFRVIPFGTADDLDKLPMFSQLFRQLGVELPRLVRPEQSLLVDPGEHAFNVFHVPEAVGSPYVPAQEEFVQTHGIRSVLGFGAPLPDGQLFSIILFSQDVIPESTAELFKPLALCAQTAMAPYAVSLRTSPKQPAVPGQEPPRNGSWSIDYLESRIAVLERLLAVQEQAVASQAERMDLVVRGAEAGTWDWHIGTGHVTFNDRWATMLGYQPEELEPHVRTWEHLIHPDDLPVVMELVSAHLRGETALYSSEHRLRTKSGTWCWVFDSGRVVERDAAGKPVRAAGIHLDISVRKELEAAQTRAQRELQVKQQALDEAQTLAHLGFWEWDIVTGEEHWSDEQCRIFGFDPDAIKPTYAIFLAALHPDDRSRVQQAVDAAIHYDFPYNIDCRIQRPSGEVRHINCRGIVRRKPDGSPASMTGTVQDITAYKRAESAWRESETRMRSVFESAVEGIVVIDERGRIESANDAVLRLLNYEAHEFIGQNISIIMPQPYRDNHPSYLANYLVTGKRVIIGSGRDVQAVRKDGTLIDIHVSVSEMHIGTSTKYTGMIRDISERKRMEETIHESEERFRQLAESIDAVFWLTTPDKSEVLYVSPAFETIWECPREILRSNPLFWLEHIHPDDQKRVSVAAACQAHLPYDEEYRIITATGRERWIRDRSFAIKTTAGQTYRVAGIAQDITEAKELEAQLRASEQRHRTLVELSPHAIFVNYNNTIVFANQACVKLFGAIAPSQLFGKPVMDFIHPDSRATSQQRMALIQSTKGSAPSSEERFMGLDGTTIDVEVTAAAVRFEGKPAIQVILTDIRARKELERALLATNLQLETILASATKVSIIAINTEGMITTFNAGAEEMLGYSAEEMIGQQMLAALHLPEEVAKHTRDMSELHASPIDELKALTQQTRVGGFDEQEWTYRRKDGDCLTVLVTMTVLKNSDGVLTGFLAIGKDITERKAAEAALSEAARELARKNVELAQARDAALEAAKLKADFLATMSHEIRTPMNAIIGMTGLLLDTALTEEQHDFADTVRRSSDALLTIVNDILDFSKIEAGKLHFEQVAFDLRLAVEDTIELMAEQAQSKGLELIALVDAAVPAGVVGDPGRLRQILVNLVSNAVKFTSAGEIFVHVTRETGEGPNHLRFAITDTGIGISDEAQKKLFQAFVQADSSTTRRFGGTGLGLAICQRLVQQMQGRIGIESRPGEGSTFWFTVQLPEAALSPAPSTLSWDRLSGRRILIVDPNNRVRQVLQQDLAGKGLQCSGARNAGEAVSLAQTAATMQKPFDLALIELHLPDKDGFETARLLKDHAATSAMQLVILTTVGRRGDGTTARQLGINAYLSKPLRQTQLLECFCQVLDVAKTDAAPDTVSLGTPPLITRHTLAETHTATTPRLLLAEDNPVNQKVACKMLEKLGYRVDVASNGQEAVSAHERMRYPLIFMDCQMPEVDGFEATALIRKMEGKSAHTPIVAMTANAMQGDRERCLAAGMDDYVAKPIRPKDLQAMLDTWLGNRIPKTGTAG